MIVKFNTDKVNDLRPFLDAIIQGKTIQYFQDGNYLDYCGPDASIDFSIDRNRRIKPDPKLRAWKAGEVPVGALIRSESLRPDCRVAIIGVDGPTKTIIDATPENLGPSSYSFDYAFRNYQYSADNGKTWHPCGVLE